MTVIVSEYRLDGNDNLTKGKKRQQNANNEMSGAGTGPLPSSIIEVPISFPRVQLRPA
jgi:hypothetical protein